jgi:hypothetical protein
MLTFSAHAPTARMDAGKLDFLLLLPQVHEA